ncbi:hypothetical protein DMENIID0001_020840 [Sergentomyia squamirostris]
MFCTVNRGSVIQFSVAFLACLTELTGCMFLAWTSPVVGILMTEHTVLKSGSLTEDQVSFMVSLLYYGQIAGALLGGWLVNVIGRKRVILASVIPQLVSSALTILAQIPLMLYTAKVLTGLSLGIVIVVVPIFTAEISGKKLRTTINNLFGININIGIFLGKILTEKFGYYAVPIAIITITIIFVGLFVLIPDSPEYLVYRSRFEDAESSLKFYRGVKSDDPLPRACIQELEEMKTILNHRSQQTSVTIKDFTSGSTILTLFITFMITSNMNFTGNRITTSFTDTILESSGILMDISLIEMIISLVLIFMSILVMCCVCWLGVRFSMICFYVISFVSLSGAAVQFYMVEHNMFVPKWPFITSISLAIVIPATGVINPSLPIPALLLPMKIKGCILGIFNVANLILAFFMVQTYFTVVQSFGHSNLMFSFGCWCVLGALFTFYILPEVSNKSYSELCYELEWKAQKIFRIFNY